MTSYVSRAEEWSGLIRWPSKFADVYKTPPQRCSRHHTSECHEGRSSSDELSPKFCQFSFQNITHCLLRDVS